MKAPSSPRVSNSRGGWLERVSSSITTWTGSATAFGLAVGVVLVWAISGPFFGYSETWQLVINTGTTIITFLMVFLIQRSQNKDSLAVQLKLNELVAATAGASNRLVAVEELSEHDLHVLRDFYDKLTELARREHDLAASHSVEEARNSHATKMSKRRSMKKKTAANE